MTEETWCKGHYHDGNRHCLAGWLRLICEGTEYYTTVYYHVVDAAKLKFPIETWNDKHNRTYREVEYALNQAIRMRELQRRALIQR